MIRSIGAIAALVLFISLNSKVPEDPVTQVSISDSVSFKVFASKDSLGLIELYGARIYTPVCEGGKCYSIELNLYWDLTGRFSHYDTLPGRGLSKLDHIPFTEADYLKLKAILSNPHSMLANFSKEELVKNTRSSSIDGITGATISEIREEVIEGAVYSCYTLWHIANGAVSDSLQRITRHQFSKELVQKMVQLEDQHVSYFLIHNFSERDFTLYLPEVLAAMENGEGYFVKNAIETLPPKLVCDSLSQDYFARYFQQMDYFAQVALLEKLNSNCISANLLRAVNENKENRNTYKDQLINKLNK